MYQTIITSTFKLNINYIKKLLEMMDNLPFWATIDLEDEDLTEEQQHDYVQALFLQTLLKNEIIDISKNSIWNYSINSNIPHYIS